MQPLLYFMHIQKNGGNTVRDWLDRQFPGRFREFHAQKRVKQGRARTWANSLDVLCDVKPLVEDNEVLALAGNLPFGLHEHVERPIIYAVTLRDPIERAYSFWYHSHRLRSYGNAWETIERVGRDPVSAAAEGLIQFNNEQTRMLSGTSDIELEKTHYFNAQRNLQSRDVYSCTISRLQDMLASIAKRYDLRPEKADVINVGDKSDVSVLTKDLDRKFAMLNSIDQRLFEWYRRTHVSLAFASG